VSLEFLIGLLAFVVQKLWPKNNKIIESRRKLTN